MDPLRIIVRVVFAYLLLQGLVRLSGKRTVKQGSPFDFAIALIIGDLVDDVLWAEVGAAQFSVAAAALVLVHTGLDHLRLRADRSPAELSRWGRSG
jgi:uncharacterized membrane protein YcaP (DUF421 family)